jgi:hypothetical protein
MTGYLILKRLQAIRHPLVAAARRWGKSEMARRQMLEELFGSSFREAFHEADASVYSRWIYRIVKRKETLNG